MIIPLFGSAFVFHRAETDEGRDGGLVNQNGKRSPVGCLWSPPPPPSNTASRFNTVLPSAWCLPDPALTPSGRTQGKHGAHGSAGLHREEQGVQ
ncbi:unnamed protein product [Arctogadus glacialis]